MATGYALVTDAEKIAKREDDAEELAMRLAEDDNLFGEGGNNAP